MLLWATASSHLGLLAQLQSRSSVPSHIRHQIPLSPTDSCSCSFNGSPSSTNCSQTPQLHTLASPYSCQFAHEKWPGWFTCISLITLAGHFFSHIYQSPVSLGDLPMHYVAYAQFSYWFAKAFYNIDPLSFIYYQYFSQSLCIKLHMFSFSTLWFLLVKVQKKNVLIKGFKQSQNHKLIMT